MRKIILIFACFLAAISSKAHHYDFESGGMYFNVLSSEDKTCELTHGYYPNEYNGDFKIPSAVYCMFNTYKVIRIGEDAFRDCTQITSVNIPTSISEIGEGAFYNCRGITSVVIPKSVTVIRDRALMDVFK